MISPAPTVMVTPRSAHFEPNRCATPRHSTAGVALEMAALDRG
jgi:hypothetical protein